MTLVAMGAAAFSIETETRLRGIQYGTSFKQKSWPAGLDFKVDSVTYVHMTRLRALITAIKIRLKYGFESVDLKHLGATLGPQRLKQTSVAKADVVHIAFINDMLHASHSITM